MNKCVDLEQYFSFDMTILQQQKSLYFSISGEFTRGRENKYTTFNLYAVRLNGFYKVFTEIAFQALMYFIATCCR